MSRKMRKMNKLFTYGTLMDSEKESDSYVFGSLYDLGNFPGIKLTGNNMIPGQVIEVTDEELEALDMYEGCPFLYSRKKIIAYDKNLDSKDEVWIYEYNGDIEKYSEISRWP